MPTDKQNVDFLYSIIKQLEVKHIAWSTIADQNNVPNGHAARMRFHRLKQAQEGRSPVPRVKKDLDHDPSGKKGNGGKDKSLKRKAKEDGEKLRKKLRMFDEEEEDDEEEPLRDVRRRMRVKREDGEGDEESGDEYVPEGIKREETGEEVEDAPVGERGAIKEEPRYEGYECGYVPEAKQEPVA